jgi:hypothetical protein
LLLLQPNGGDMMERVEHAVDPLMRGYKLSLSISIPSNLVARVIEMKNEERRNLSEMVVRLLRLGITYLEVLEEQKKQRQVDALKDSKPIASTKKKKPKRKTPSKKK